MLAWASTATLPAFSLAVHWTVPRRGVPAGGEGAQPAENAALAGTQEGSGSGSRGWEMLSAPVASTEQLQAEAAGLRARLAQVEARLAAAGQ